MEATSGTAVGNMGNVGNMGGMGMVQMNPMGGMNAFGVNMNAMGGMNAMGAGYQMPQMVMAQPAPPPAHKNVREGDWLCKACGNHNYANRTSCNKCGAPQAEAGAPMTLSKPGGGSVRPGDWICPNCNNHNYANREVCNKCQTPKPEGAGMEGGYSAASGSAAKAAPGPYTRNPYLDKPTAEFKEGDWQCPSCSNHNYSTRVKCNKCGQVREGFKENDWICKACKNHNYASKMSCNKCGAPREGMMMGAGMMMMGKGGAVMMPMAMGKNMKEGDWMCSACGNHNYSSRTACNKCGAARPGFKPGDWICKSCKNHNYSSRDSCNKCDAPKGPDQ